MKKVTPFVIIILMLFNTYSHAQDPNKYAELIKEAWKLYENKEYLKSGQKYSEAFVALGNMGSTNDRYNAACSWALANEKDSSFIQLFKIAEKGKYTNYNHITTDIDLNSLHADERWKQVLEIIKINKDKEEANFDKPLVVQLDSIYQEDQKHRKKIPEIQDKYGWESPEMQNLLIMMNRADSINLIKVKKILDEKGWLGEDKIGRQGNSTLFLVIQHADHETQLKYLPIMREAVKKGNAHPANLALLEDRVLLRMGKKQIYGSQIGRDNETGAYFVFPLEDPDNVDKRRQEVGLESIKDYAARNNIEWDLEEYKKKLPELEENQKKENNNK